MRVHQRPNESMYAFMDRVLTLIDRKRHLTQTLLGLDKTQWGKVAFIAVLKGMPTEAVQEAINQALLKTPMPEAAAVQLALDLEEGWLEEVNSRDLESDSE